MGEYRSVARGLVERGGNMIKELLEKVKENKKIRKMLKKSRYQKLKEKYNTLENEYITYRKEKEQEIDTLLDKYTKLKLKDIRSRKKLEK